MNKKFMSLMGIVVIGGSILTGCGEAEVSTVEGDNSGNSGSEETTEESKEEKKPEFYNVGDTVSIDGMEVTLKNVNYVEANEYTPSENGKVLQLEVHAKNNSADNGFVDSSEFQVYDADGNKHDLYFGSDDMDVNMWGGELKQGKQQDGKLQFDVPESDFYEIYYEPSFTLKDNAEITFKVKADEIK